MKVDAVIFDKDGTLTDFNTFWVSVSVKAIEDVLRGLGREDIPAEEILKAYGVVSGAVDVDAALRKATYEKLGQIAYEILKKYNCDISCEDTVKRIEDAYKRNADAGQVLPTCSDLAEVLKALKRQGKKLAVVTTDNPESTSVFLKKLGVEALFDAVYTDDGVSPAKPDPWCALDFLERNGIKKERAVMVGDTMTDVRFAKNAGISVIGVAETEKGRKLLASHAAAVIADLSALPALLD